MAEEELRTADADTVPVCVLGALTVDGDIANTESSPVSISNTAAIHTSI